jgi:hypothetical protein
MGNSHKEAPGSPSAAVARTAFSAFEALDAPGPRGVRIFGLPRQQLIKAAVVSGLFVIPLTIVIGMMPFWDRLGEFPALKQLNAYVAPAVDHLDYEYRSRSFPRLPLKRFLIASAVMVELIFLSNLVALFSRSVRRHALLVWACYDRAKVFQYLGISGAIFCSFWYVLSLMDNFSILESGCSDARQYVSLCCDGDAFRGICIRPYGDDCWPGELANYIAKTEAAAQGRLMIFFAYLRCRDQTRVRTWTGVVPNPRWGALCR